MTQTEKNELSDYMTRCGVHPAGGYQEPQNLWKNEYYGRTIKNTDQYYNEVHNAWYPVPVHWVGLNTLTVDHHIK